MNSVYDKNWYETLSRREQARYDGLADDISDLLKSRADSHNHDNYVSFAPLFLRTSFHAAGTFHHGTGKGGTNGGTLRHSKENGLAKNECIDIATDKLQELARDNRITFADSTAIAGALALKEMEFPDINRTKVRGGRVDKGKAHQNIDEDKLPESGVNPLGKFTDEFDMSEAEIVTLIGGSHSFGAAHPTCSGYVGHWSRDSLRWDVDGEGPDFFTSLVADDWEWFTVNTFADNTTTYSRVDEPTFRDSRDADISPNGFRIIERNDKGSNNIDSRIQAMRGCELDFDETHGHIKESSCTDGGTPVIRIPADFWLLKHKALEPHVVRFAKDDALFAEQFALAFSKMLNMGFPRDVKKPIKTDTPTARSGTKKDNNNDCKGQFWKQDSTNCCEDWAFFGECDNTPHYMNKHCPIACEGGERDRKASLVDYNTHCSEWAEQRHCTGKFESFMAKVCRASCSEKGIRFH